MRQNIVLETISVFSNIIKKKYANYKPDSYEMIKMYDNNYLLTRKLNK